MIAMTSTFPMKTIFAGLLVGAALGLGLSPAEAAERKPRDILGDPNFKKVVKKLPVAEQLELAATLNFSLRQYEPAIPMLEALVKKQPTRADLWFLLAMAYNRVSEPREAYDAANIALTLKPDMPFYPIERGIAAFQLGKDAEAVRDLQRYVRSFKTSAMAHYYLGLVQARLGDLGTARDNLRKARTLSPNLSLLTDYYLGLIAAQQGKPEEARPLLQATAAAFKGTGSPMEKQARQQLEQLKTPPSR